MDRFFDMHCHLLPKVDDGAQNMEETRKMLRMAYKEGIRYIAATPHHHPGRGKAKPEILRRQLKLVRREAEKISPDLRVYLGNEIYFGQDVPEKIREGRILTLNGSRYVLVEFSPSDEFDYIRRGIQQIQMSGYEVILAHIERYRCMREKPEYAWNVKEMGALIQVNADGVAGHSGMAVKRYIRHLMDEDLVYCVGTDAHDPSMRPPRMKKAAELVEKKYGKDYMRRIFFSNARVMLRKKRTNESGKANARH